MTRNTSTYSARSAFYAAIINMRARACKLLYILHACAHVRVLPLASAVRARASISRAINQSYFNFTRAVEIKRASSVQMIRTLVIRWPVYSTPCHANATMQYMRLLHARRLHARRRTSRSYTRRRRATSTPTSAYVAEVGVYYMSRRSSLDVTPSMRCICYCARTRRAVV
jgi:hypothetical protein